MAHDPHAGIVGEHSRQAFVHGFTAISNGDLTGVERIAHAHAAAMVEADPRSAGSGIKKSVQDRPIGDRVGAVAHGLGLAVGARDGAAVEMIAAYDNRRAYFSLFNEPVESPSHLGALPIAEPADARG